MCSAFANLSTYDLREWGQWAAQFMLGAEIAFAGYPGKHRERYHCLRKQVQPPVFSADISFGPALAHNGWNVLKIAERVLLLEMLDIRNAVFLIFDISM